MSNLEHINGGEKPDFTDLVNRAITEFGLPERDLIDMFSISKQILEEWTEGRSGPDSAFQTAVIRFLAEVVTRKRVEEIGGLSTFGEIPEDLELELLGEFPTGEFDAVDAKRQLLLIRPGDRAFMQKVFKVCLKGFNVAQSANSH